MRAILLLFFLSICMQCHSTDINYIFYKNHELSNSSELPVYDFCYNTVDCSYVLSCDVKKEIIYKLYWNPPPFFIDIIQHDSKYNIISCDNEYNYTLTVDNRNTFISNNEQRIGYMSNICTKRIMNNYEVCISNVYNEFDHVIMKITKYQQLYYDGALDVNIQSDVITDVLAYGIVVLFNVLYDQI